MFFKQFLNSLILITGCFIIPPSHALELDEYCKEILLKYMSWKNNEVFKTQEDLEEELEQLTILAEPATCTAEIKNKRLEIDVWQLGSDNGLAPYSHKKNKRGKYIRKTFGKIFSCELKSKDFLTKLQYFCIDHKCLIALSAFKQLCAFHFENPENYDIIEMIAYCLIVAHKPYGWHLAKCDKSGDIIYDNEGQPVWALKDDEFESYDIDICKITEIIKLYEIQVALQRSNDKALHRKANSVSKEYNQNDEEELARIPAIESSVEIDEQTRLQDSICNNTLAFINQCDNKDSQQKQNSQPKPNAKLMGSQSRKTKAKPSAQLREKKKKKLQVRKEKHEAPKGSGKQSSVLKDRFNELWLKKWQEKYSKPDSQKRGDQQRGGGRKQFSKKSQMKKLINNLQILNKLGVSVVMNPPVQKVGASKNAKEAKFLLEKWAQNFPPSNKQSSNTIWDKNAEQLLIKFMEKSGNIKYNSLGNLRGRLKAINNKIEIIDNHKIKILNFPKSFYDYAITPYGNYIQIPFQDSCILNGTGFLAKIQSCSPSQRENLSLNLFDILYRACIKNPSQARIIGIMTLCLMTVNDPYMFYSYKTQNGKVILDDKGKEVVFFDEKKMDQHGKKLEASALFIQESILETILNEGQLDRFIMLPSKRRMLLAAYIVEAFPRVKEALYKINNPKAVGDFALTPKDKTKIERAKELLCQISHKQTVSESKDKSKSKIKKQVKKNIKRRKGRRKGYRARR